MLTSRVHGLIDTKKCVQGREFSLSNIPPPAPSLPLYVKAKTSGIIKPIKTTTKFSQPAQKNEFLIDELKSKGVQSFKKTSTNLGSPKKDSSVKSIVTTDALSKQMKQLKTTLDVHPNQLTKLDTLSEADLYSISHIIKKVKKNRLLINKQYFID